ncbi:MAG: ABC transporter ATP-binding protein [Candidatus Thermoplasmatota archaeon]
MTESVISVSDLVKVYGEVRAVDGISFEVRKGEVFSLVGPNGAGKTTAVEILECLRKPTSGTASVLGFDVCTEEREIKRRIGVLPQDFNAFERLTARENVELVARIYGAKGRVEDILRSLDMWDVRKKKFMSLSGGMKQRTGICMALVSDPELVFLDEPTTGLDPKARVETWEVIRNLKRMGKTVVLTTHYMEEVEHLCDRAAVIVRGRIAALDSVGEMIDRYGGGIKLKVRDAVAEVESSLKGRTPEVSEEHDGTLIGVFRNRMEASQALVELYRADQECRAEISEPTMDDVFLRLTGARIDERGELL